MEEHDPSKSGDDLPSNREKYEVIKRYFKRQNKQDQAKKPSSDTEEDLKKRNKDFFRNFKKTKYEISTDEENRQPRSHTSTYPKHFKKNSPRFPENVQGRRESSATIWPRHRSSKSRTCSNDSSIIESPIRNPYPEGFDLRSILRGKSQENTDRNQPNKRYKSLVYERSSSVEMDIAHQFRRREPRSQRRSKGGSLHVHERSSSIEMDTAHQFPRREPRSQRRCNRGSLHFHERSSSVEMDNAHQFSRREPRSQRRSCRSSLPSVEIENANIFSRRKPKSQRRSSNHSQCRSCRCRTYDSFSSSENESYHSTNHESGLSRYHSRRSYHRKKSRSHYPGRKKSRTHRHSSPSSIHRVPIDMAPEPHSSRSQPVFQSDYLDHYNPVGPSRSQFHRSYDLKREPHSTQNHARGHLSYKRDRSSSLEQWGWSRSPSKDNEYSDKDLAIEKRRHEAKKIKVSSSAKKQKFPINEIRRSPTLDRGNSRRYSGTPKKTLKGEPSKDKLKKEKCPVDKDYNKRLYEEFINTTRKNIENWITSNDESNSIERRPRVFSSVATKNEPVQQTESQDIASQEIEVLIEKCRAKSQELTSKESKPPVEQNPIVVTSNEMDQSAECEIPKVAFDKKRVSDEKYLCEEFIAPDITALHREVLNIDQCEVFEGPEIPKVTFDEKRVAVEKYLCQESIAPDVTVVQREVSNIDQCEVSEGPEIPKVTFDEIYVCEESIAPDVTVVQREVSSKDQCEVSEGPEIPKVTFDDERVSDYIYLCEESIAKDVTVVQREVSNENQCEASEGPEITFIEERKFKNEKNQGDESEALEISFAEREFSSEEKLEKSEVSFIEEKKVTSEEAPDITFVEMEVSNEDHCVDLDPEVTFVEEKKVMKGNIHRGKSETLEVSFVDREVPNENDECEQSEVTNEEHRLQKPEARKITSKIKEPFRTTISRSEKPPAIQKEYKERKPTMPNSFFCNLCQIQLTSEITFNTHMVGRKHKKKMQSVYKIATNSLRDLPIITLDDTPRFDQPPRGKKRKLTWKRALLQSTIDEITNEPVAGLEYVHEIISSMDVGYYCTLCDAPCQAVSIMPHLIGIRHQLQVARQLFPDYDLDGDHHDQDLRRKVRRMLIKYENKYGRGRIQVFREEDDPDMRPSAYNQAGPSNRYPTMRFIKNEPNEDRQEQPPRNVMPDMSKGDFFCRICDSHMNNLNMWEQHLRGHRHLQNVQKVPGESISKIRTEKLPGIVSKLEQLIDERASGDLIVGLDYIRETRGPAGELYNCFLCGACCTNYDILEHITLLKHRTKYLEQLNFEGKCEDILEINGLELKVSGRESLVVYQCYIMEGVFGRGKVEVYKNKS